jgi:hypothetical protein
MQLEPRTSQIGKSAATHSTVMFSEATEWTMKGKCFYLQNYMASQPKRLYLEYHKKLLFSGFHSMHQCQRSISMDEEAVTHNTR